MKQVKKSVLLWYSPHEMYSLVTDIPSYPKFLPWCERTEILSQDASGMTARIHLSFMGVRQSFTTRNTHETDRSVKVELVDGPFSVLQGSWIFKTLPSPDGQPQNTCKIEFELAYAFSNKAFELVLSPVFDKVANTFVDSFVKRAEQVYGAR
jgi:ribosome-associated toxin RatA of RatAB toxin-antitoxin module